MAFDIAKKNLATIAEEGVEFEVKLPDGSPTEWFIKVRGSLAPTVKSFSKATLQRMQLKEQRAKRTGKEVEFDLEDTIALAIDSATVRVVSWCGLEDDGKEVKPTPENIKRIMTELDWVRAQVLDEAENAANFV